MTLDDQARHFEMVYSLAVGTLQNRARDYAPGGVPLLNLLETAVEKNVSIESELWSLFKKQQTAIQRYVLHGIVDSDPLRSRVIDACNYLVFFEFYNSRRTEIHAAWEHYWRNEPCEPECRLGSLWHPERPLGTVTVMMHVLHECQRCQTLWWLARHSMT